ncbi:phthiocerol synthesis polyketide synthase type I PpsA [Mycolicibacterium murale]|uniref:Phthiocerol synthesis polyketide synthase type I PpsA n=1 Tax=Mycolicibacterium murale TaxID=182220 RepID=A0A7I9WKU0_9MYCO|nr:type I polyketide synthase [Mycolicibacterium murale]MCV7184778.1 SDR family NAD(P)-dependent oxidoreductase [Mycolicibacterium murale]GFG58371.1 phthiocerol synthesis polyketide synthase type I PpsA [Mycolicibacterium murale]
MDELLGKPTQTTVGPQPAPEPIAIVGIGCRLAGGVTTPAQFWQLLLDGGSAVREIPAERWEPYLRRDPRNAAVLTETTPFGSFLDDLAGFDAEFFGVSPREAELMDPQQRLAVEVCWEALEHAGIAPRSVAGSDTAVLMGVNSDDYGKLLMEDLPGIEAWTGIGTSLCGVANRVSHLLDLRGPSVALDAACAASLVAVHQACQLLRDGETTLALAGGVSALIGPGLTRVLDVAGATAPDGRCKSFDASADGYGRGEGAAVVVLKRVSDARRDGDRVLAVIRGGAVAQDGRTVGIMSPNGDAQAQLFRRACAVAQVPPDSVGFIEAHGTGTPTGDPVELTALAQVYGAGRDAPCAVGSVKPNTGHLEGAAGVVGLMKAALALHHKVIPATAGIRKLTRALDWPASGLRVPTEPEPWREAQGPRRAAVCSYGYGGTIAHVLLEEAPESTAETSGEPLPVVLPISARSQARLTVQAAALADALDGQPLEQVATTLWTRRSHEPVRAAVVAESRDDAAAALRAIAAGGRDPRVVTGTAVPDTGAVWVFSGHGSHWAGMGSELLDTETRFAEVIDAVAPVFADELGFSPREALRTGELGGTDRVQALTFAIQVGLAAVLRERGVEPSAVIGHSVGEVAACVVSGVLNLQQGAHVACYRARGFRTVQGHGAMALVGLPYDEADARLQGRTEVVAAISSSPVACVISGAIDAVEAVCSEWADEGVSVRRVATDVAFHSPAMDALTGDLARLTAQLGPSAPACVPLYSTALADPRSAAPRDPDYWVINLRGRVRFAEAVSAAVQDGHRVFVEVSAHPVVAHSVIETVTHLGMPDPVVIPVLRRDQPQTRAVHAAVAALHCHGVEVRSRRGPWACDLPGTQWQHRQFWRTPTPPPGGHGVHDVATHTLLGGRLDVATTSTVVWQTRLDLDTRPYPGDHPVQGTEIVPAAVLLNTFLAAAGADLSDVRLRTPVAPGRTRDVQLVRRDDTLALSTRLIDDDGGWLTHSIAAVAADVVEPAAAQPDCPEGLAPGHVVSTLAGLGVAAMGFGWDILDLRRGTGQLLARVSAEADGSVPASWASLLDAATSAASTVFDGPPRLRMPARVDRVHVYGAAPAVGVIHVVRRPGTTITDVTIRDTAGALLVYLHGMGFEELETAGAPAQILHELVWSPTPYPADARPGEVVLVGGDPDTLAVAQADLTAAGVPFRLCPEPEAIPGDLGPRTVVLVLPRDQDCAAESVQQVLDTLAAMHTGRARLWVLTRRVHEGDNVTHAPLWGVARVAAAEHPRVWGGVLDLADARIPLGALASLAGNGVVAVRDGVARVAHLDSAAPGPGAPLTCSPAGTYVITGGTGALGLRMAQHLADRGARRLVLLSRSGVPPRSQWGGTDSEATRVVAALEERGVSVQVAAVDIGAPDAAETLRAALADLPRVRGVIHAAGVEAGALLLDTTGAHLAATMRPKVDGAMALHQVFAPGELDWLVLFSSCGYLPGFPGQGAYAAANAFLDVFAQHRRNLGDRTTSVAWTAWRGLGMGSTSGFIAAQLEALGMGTVAADDALAALDNALRADRAHLAVLPVLPAAAAVPMLAAVAPEAESRNTTTEHEGTPAGPGDADPAEWAQRQVLAAVAAELGLAADDVDLAMPLVEIGVDSIMTVAVRRALEKQTGLALPPTLLWEHPTAAAVTSHLVELLTADRESVEAC